jgi:hypothetical protein
MLNETLIQTLHDKIQRRKFSRADGPAELSKGESYHPAKGRVELF